MKIADRPVLRCLITTGEATASTFEHDRERISKTVRLALAAGIDYVQIREKQITTKQLFELSRSVVEAAKNTHTQVFVNGRADVARAASAAGVHLPEDGVPIDAIRKAFGIDLMIGASVHSIQAALDAKEKGADLVVFGPVFDSPGKVGQGIDALRDVLSALEGHPVLAVGGIDASNVNQVIESGAAGFAAIRYLNDERTLVSISESAGAR